MKQFLALFLSLALLLPLSGCLSLLEDDTPSERVQAGDTPHDTAISATPISETDNHWVIYWYLCGSDLESVDGSATDDLDELTKVRLPEGVQVVIQTGGSTRWKSDQINADYSERYLYDSNGVQLLAQLPLANMGEVSTLTDFLTYAHQNFPGDRTMLNFWGHGNSLDGVAFDELFDEDSLTYPELATALATVYGEHPQNYPLDIVSFDACLMANMETASVFDDYANYMVASQESVPGFGLDYTRLVEQFVDDPTIAPIDLAVAICDDFLVSSQEWHQEYLTMSVTDLSKFPSLLEAYDQFGTAALLRAVEDSTFLTELSRFASVTENYGGNYSNNDASTGMDLGQFALLASEVLPTASQAVLQALDETIIHTVSCEYRPDAMGLSCYYYYTESSRDVTDFQKISASEAFGHLYRYGLSGDLKEAGRTFLETLAPFSNEIDEIKTIDASWQGIPFTFDESKTATLSLGPDAADILSSVNFELSYSPPDDSYIFLTLGTDSDLIRDWENGIFKDNFAGTWVYLDDAICYMDLVYEGDSYNEYRVPVLINGEAYHLLVVCDLTTDQFEILGARKPQTENGLTTRHLYQLQVGDVIETVHNISSFDPDAVPTPTPIDTVVYNEQTTFEERILSDGYYYIRFVMEDIQGNRAYSDYANFQVVDGVVHVTVPELS